MKMISSTSMTSTSGTTLISLSELATRRPRPARAVDPPGPDSCSFTYVKFLSAMFRNSIAKSSMPDANTFTRWVRPL